jgi:secernin
MCDTLVALGNSTRDGSVLFAKNSDRQPNEPHIMIRIPRTKHDLNENKYLKATYIELPQVEETYEVVLLKPSWIWGCEMGWNEYGLNIGNEAVFTKENMGKTGLIGMDMARIALERCKTSEEAVDTITGLLEEFGQGGNCGFEKPFTYHNSFLIADKKTAWVLETADIYWVVKQVKDVYCISNCLSIENDYDRCHPDVVRNAMEKGWCRNEKDFGFAKSYSDKLFTRVSKSVDRRKMCDTALSSAKGKIDISLMKSILRSHDPKLGKKLFHRGSLNSVCMHAGGAIGDQTTGSYAASLSEKLCTYWVTGASAPCISLFKPLWMTADAPVFSEGDQARAVDYWMKREKLHRYILGGFINLQEYIEERDRLELLFHKEAEYADEIIRDTEQGRTADVKRLSEIMRHAFDVEAEFVEDQLAGVVSGKTGSKLDDQDRIRPLKQGGLYFRHFWKKQNRKCFGNIKG